MAELNSLTSKVYRSGRYSGPSEKSPRTVTKKHLQEHVWAWLPQYRVQLIVEQAYRAAQAACTPPDGVPFVDDGLPWASKDGFADALVDEFRSLVFMRLGAWSGGTLSSSADAIAAVGQQGDER
jgi:hypothetical protein